VANVAFLPGIQAASLAMPDIHWGYGFCIGGVCGGAGSADTADAGGDEAVSGGGSGYVAVGGACTYDEDCSQEGAPAVCRDNGLPGDGAYNCCRYGGHACGDDSHCCVGYVCLGGVCSGG